MEARHRHGCGDFDCRSLSVWVDRLAEPRKETRRDGVSLVVQGLDVLYEFSGQSLRFEATRNWRSNNCATAIGEA